MKNRQFKFICMCLVFTFMLIQSTSGYVFANTVTALASNTISTAISLTPGKSYSKTVAYGDEIWFKVDPSALASSKSHIKFEVKGVSYYISVYNSLANATKNKAHKNYLNKTSAISYPIAWIGPYYVKIKASAKGTMTIASTAEVKAPTTPSTSDNFCSGEALAQTDSSISSLLPTLRSFRDGILNETALGKEITDIYYSASSEILDKVVFDTSFRKELTANVLNISTLLKELKNVAETGTSSYVLTESDYKSLSNLHDLVASKVDDQLKSRIDKIWTDINLKEYVGSNLGEFIRSSNISSKGSTKSEILVDTNSSLTVEQVKSKIESVLHKNGVNSSVNVKTAGDEKVKIDNSYIVSIEGNSGVNKLIDVIKKDTEFKNVSENITVIALASDVQYKTEWNLQNTAQKVPNRTANGIVDTIGKTGSDINYAGLTSYLTGKSVNKTLIAVVDTGINYELADLQGVVDYKNGYDFVNNDNDAMDDNDHGTHVSGIIASKANNGYSMTGINSNATILPVKVLSSTGSGTEANIAKGIKYAVDKGAKVINLSLGIRRVDGTAVKPEEVPQIEAQIKYAYSKGVTVVAAAGNESKANLSYPANSKYVVSVGATENKDGLAYFSNYGTGIDMAAPGVSIPSLISNGEVAYLSGTSMAAPHVAAIAGLLYSLNGAMTPAKAESILKSTSTDLGTKGYDTKYGYGRLNAAKAAAAAKS
ncbi:MAG: S8 family serine peptidase [Clostridiaceae bacterium]